ncbi:MAG: M20/M25/M40 family metallo-hydrolase [Bacteroidales bacterium]|nr:M20/M25/M40 family metallo-hydrolase [Bacteroidales bacterium]
MKQFRYVIAFLFVIFSVQPLRAQKTGLESININDLKRHMQFLASDELEGRETGSPGLQVAARYLAVQAESLGLLPLDKDKDYMQPYLIRERAYDRENSSITISAADSVSVSCTEPFYFLPAPGADHTVIEGELVFAGYGINSEEHGYNDFANIDIQDKVVLIMNRAPMNEEGTESQFDHGKWTGMQNFQYKMPYIFSRQPRAVLIVMDPKSGMESIEDVNPAVARYLSKSRVLYTEDVEQEGTSSVNRPGMVMIHRRVADQLLAKAGKNLGDLQMEIDQNFSPQSFYLEGTRVKIELNMETRDREVFNVFGLIEGSNLVQKDEVVIYMAHYDHVGTDGQGAVFNGADDNASGTVALLEIAEAFLKETKRPGRRIGILWVSAEEIGLYGSQYFAEHPLVPGEKIAAVINLDMVGRTKMKEDELSTRSGLTIQGGDSVKVIGGLQSKVLMKINRQTLAEAGLVGNYQYNNLTDPNRYFFRSDHISFARKDIPVLFYSTGTQRDYHLISDVEEVIDYEKFLKMTKFCYRTGFNVAQYKGPIKVDNPMTSW